MTRQELTRAVAWDSRSWDEDEDVLPGQLGEVDLLLHVVDLDLDIRDGVTDFEGRGRSQRGEGLVGGLGGSLQEGCWGGERESLVELLSW